ncbi:MAG: GNAT family N-acetyltransferase [Bacillota bacterium]
MNITFVPMNDAYAQEIIDQWHYEGQYSVYDYVHETDWIQNKEVWGSGLFAALGQDGELIGELSIQFFDPSEVAFDPQDISPEAKVLWIGFGLKPDLTGKGYGPGFVRSCAEFAVERHRYQGSNIGLGVYAFNQRAIKAYQKAGFAVYHSLRSELLGKEVDAFYMKKCIK